MSAFGTEAAVESSSTAYDPIGTSRRAADNGGIVHVYELDKRPLS